MFPFSRQRAAPTTKVGVRASENPQTTLWDTSELSVAATAAYDLPVRGVRHDRVERGAPLSAEVQARPQLERAMPLDLQEPAVDVRRDSPSVKHRTLLHILHKWRGSGAAGFGG